MDAAQIEVQYRVHTRAYMLFIIGGVLFPSSSRDVVHPRYMQLLMEESEIRDYAWGEAVLAHLYRSLTLTADRSVCTFNGCRLLLMLWAYERFAPGRPEIALQQEIRWPRARAWAEPVKMPITPESLETSSSLVTPFVHLGMGGSSVPSELRDIFDMDSVEDLAEDAAKRGGPERRGDMTRPLKNRKARIGILSPFTMKHCNGLTDTPPNPR
ncbi:hypothetical protein AgCh_039068 [Apium graveolens]